LAPPQKVVEIGVLVARTALYPKFDASQGEKISALNSPQESGEKRVNSQTEAPRQKAKKYQR